MIKNMPVKKGDSCPDEQQLKKKMEITREEAIKVNKKLQKLRRPTKETLEQNQEQTKKLKNLDIEIEEEKQSEEKVSTKNHKLFCFRCGAEIPEKIKRKTNKYNTIKGRCPSCKRPAVFAIHAELMGGTENEIAKPKKMRAIVEEEKERNKIIPSKVTASFNGQTVEMTGRIVAEKRKKGMCCWTFLCQ